MKIDPLFVSPMTHNMIYINIITAVSIGIFPRLCASPYRQL